MQVVKAPANWQDISKLIHDMPINIKRELEKAHRWEVYSMDGWLKHRAIMDGKILYGTSFNDYVIVVDQAINIPKEQL